MKLFCCELCCGKGTVLRHVLKKETVIASAGPITLNPVVETLCPVCEGQGHYHWHWLPLSTMLKLSLRAREWEGDFLYAIARSDRAVEDPPIG